MEGGAYVGIATHDEKLVWGAMQLIEELKLGREDYEFQMLLGVDEELGEIIRKANHRLRIYVTYGEQWHAYSIRRLKENPKIAWYIVQALFK